MLFHLALHAGQPILAHLAVSCGLGVAWQEAFLVILLQDALDDVAAQAAVCTREFFLRKISLVLLLLLLLLLLRGGGAQQQGLLSESTHTRLGGSLCDLHLLPCGG